MYRKLAMSALLLVMLVAAGSAHAAIITSINVTNMSDGNDVPLIVSPVVEDVNAFIDRNHTLVQIPQELLGTEQVRLANDDKRDVNLVVEINVAQRCYVYLMIDRRYDWRSDPNAAWVNDLGFTQTEMEVAIDEGHTGNINNWFDVYVLAVDQPGTVTLYGQNTGGNMYCVFVGPPLGEALRLPDSPGDGQGVDEGNVLLKWFPGYWAKEYNVYLSTDQAAVENRDPGALIGIPSDPELLVGASGWNKYYWAVDAVNDVNTSSPWLGTVQSFQSSQVFPIVDPNLMVWYKFDEADMGLGDSDIVVDSSGNSRHAAFAGPLNPTRAIGKARGAIECSGAGDYVEYTGDLSFLNGLHSFSYALWVKSDIVGTDRGFLEFEDPAAGSDKLDCRFDDQGATSGVDNCLKYGINLDNGTSTNSMQEESPADSQRDTWMHVAMSWTDGQLMKFYIDGVQQTPAAVAGIQTGVTTGLSRLMVGKGCKDSSATMSWDGLIDDVRIYNKALTEAEIQQIIAGDPKYARDPMPGDGVGADLDVAATLTWTAGATAATHRVYFGSDYNAVASADTSTAGIYQGTTTTTSFSTAPFNLKFDDTYYWRVDEVENDGVTVWEGQVWTLKVLNYLVVDNFEQYGDGTNLTPEEGNRVWYFWLDGGGYSTPQPGYSGNGTGSLVGNDPAAGHVIETNVVYGGSQSLPFLYDNTASPYISEATKTLSPARDFTAHGAKALSLAFQGRLAPGSNQLSGGVYTVTGGGADIWNTADQFHFAYMEFNSGDVTITAKVESVDNTNTWAKAGVMIRDTLDPGSTHAMVVVTPGQGISMQERLLTDQTSTSQTQGGLAAPYWVRLSRAGIAGTVTGSYSPDGVTWTDFPVSDDLGVGGFPIYVGLAVTSHDASQLCTATFSNVKIDTQSNPSLTGADIGVASNGADEVYVTLKNSNGQSAKVTYPDPAATQLASWTEWNIALTDFTAANPSFNLSTVSSITLGVGSSGSMGGAGQMYFDEILLYPPRYIPGLVEQPTADLTDDGKVNFDDAETLFSDWLNTDGELPALLAQYKMDNDATDSSGNGFDATEFGLTDPAYAPSQAGYGLALNLVGNGDHLEAPGVGQALNGSDQLTVMCWIYANFDASASGSVRDSGFIDFEAPAGNDDRDMRYDASGATAGGTNVIKTGIVCTDGRHQIETTSTEQVYNQWQHLAITWQSGSPMQLYIDGNLATDVDVETTRNGTLTGFGDLRIGLGGKDTGGTRSWPGQIDDVRVYTKSMTAAQIGVAMAGGTPDMGAPKYLPLTSAANLSPKVGDPGVYNPANPDVVNFQDLAVMLSQWEVNPVWP